MGTPRQAVPSPDVGFPFGRGLPYQIPRNSLDTPDIIKTAEKIGSAAICLAPL
jgi:hypothetical protein